MNPFMAYQRPGGFGQATASPQWAGFQQGQFQNPFAAHPFMSQMQAQPQSAAPQGPIMPQPGASPTGYANQAEYMTARRDYYAQQRHKQPDAATMAAYQQGAPVRALAQSPRYQVTATPDQGDPYLLAMRHAQSLQGGY